MLKNKPTIAEVVASVQLHGSLNKAWPHSGAGRTTFQNIYAEAVKVGLAPEVHVGDKTNNEIKAHVAGRLKARSSPKATGRKRKFILTAAQNNTHVHSVLWINLNVLAEYDKARIIVARSVYNRFAEAATMDKKLIIDSTRNNKSPRKYEWPEELSDHFVDERMELAPGLVWCGETNISPTAANPLSGFESYTGRSSSIVPHPRIAMRSVASHAEEDTKFLYTTGTLTQINYIQRRAGQMAEFHHCYGALLVEVDRDGTWFVRQLNADSDGTIYDLDRRVENGKITTGNRLKAINWGDLHPTYEDRAVSELTWGKGGMLDQLRPEYQFMHDLLDGRTVNPHTQTKKLHHHNFMEWVKGNTSVEEEVWNTAAFLGRASRPWCSTQVVASNHDDFLVQWLYKSGDFRKDPENAVFFLEAALHYWESMEQNREYPNMTKWGMERALRLADNRDIENLATNPINYLDKDESFVLCREHGGGIELGMHGHQGANGSRGTPAGLSKMGRKANIGDKHSAGIYDGLYVAGISGALDQGYNSGPGSWSQTHILTYQNGKRALATIFDGKWHA